MVAHDEIRATPDGLRHDPFRDVQRDKYSPDACIGVACLEPHVIALPCDIEGAQASMISCMPLTVTASSPLKNK
jgi:hypothetical protein